MKIALFSTLLLSTISSYSSAPNFEKANLCNSTKEYVATLQYLREKKSLGVKEEDARTIADKVSLGCVGAFNRFLKITEMLSKVGIESGATIKNAANFATQSDGQAESFIELFKQTYSADNLDLDAFNSLEISLEIAQNMKSSPDTIMNDFKKLVNHCKEEKELGLPVPFCAQMAAKVTAQGSKFGKPIADEYIELIRFVSEDKKGPQADKEFSMNLAEKIISNGPTSSENFILAYRYGVSTKGLALSAKDAISFAEKMANRSYLLKSKN